MISCSTHTYTHTPSHIHTHTITHTHTYTHTNPHAHTLTHTHSHTYIHPHALTHTHIHTPTRTHTHTHTLSGWARIAKYFKNRDCTEVRIRYTNMKSIQLQISEVVASHLSCKCTALTIVYSVKVAISFAM